MSLLNEEVAIITGAASRFARWASQDKSAREA